FASTPSSLRASTGTRSTGFLPQPAEKPASFDYQDGSIPSRTAVVAARATRLSSAIAKHTALPRVLAQRSISGQNSVYQLLHRRGEVVRVERVLLEAEGRMAGEHEILIHLATVRDVLQRLLDTEAARVGWSTGRVIVLVLPPRDTIERQAAHARLLVLADHGPLCGRDEPDGVVGRLERIGESGRDPLARPLAVLGRDPEVLAFHPHVELHRVLACVDARIRHLPLAPRLEAAQEGVAYRGAVEARRAEPVQQDVAILEFAQFVLPALGDRAFLGEKRTRS